MKTVFRRTTPYICIIQPFQILIGSLQNIWNKALSKSSMLGYFNLINTKVAEFVKQQPRKETNHLFSAKKTKSGGEKVISHIKLF